MSGRRPDRPHARETEEGWGLTDLLCSRNARPPKALVGRAQWEISQAPSLRDNAELEGIFTCSTRTIEDQPGRLPKNRLGNMGKGGDTLGLRRTEAFWNSCRHGFCDRGALVSSRFAPQLSLGGYLASSVAFAKPKGIPL